jgi:hypothetical protein
MTSLDTSSVKPYGDNKNLFHAKKKQAQKTLRFNWCHFLVCIMCNLKPGVKDDPCNNYTDVILV